MKSIISKIAILLLFSVFLFSCSNPSREEIIVGKWKFADSKLPTNKLTAEEEVQYANAIGLFKKMTISYFKDLTYETQLDIEEKDIKLNGTYKFDGDSKYLLSDGTNLNGEITHERNEIVSLSEDSLVLKSHIGFSIILVKVEE